MPVKNIRQQKTQLRAYYKKLRAECPQELKANLDRQLTSNIIKLDEYIRCETLFTFVSMPIECDTYALINDAFSRQKRVAVPKCMDKNGRMNFYYISDLSDLKKGFFSAMEPDEQKCEQVTSLSDGLCIVPGLCFDFQGYRLGFGGGYYDRFLDKFGGISVGICYSRFVESKLPKGTFDKHTDILVTEKFVNYNHNN